MADYDNRTTTPRYDTTGATDARPHSATQAAAPQRQHVASHSSKNILDWLSLVLLIVGGLNWGLVGLFGVDMVSTLFGSGTATSRAVYIAVGLAAIWGFALTRLSPANDNR